MADNKPNGNNNNKNKDNKFYIVMVPILALCIVIRIFNI